MTISLPRTITVTVLDDAAPHRGGFTIAWHDRMRFVANQGKLVDALHLAVAEVRGSYPSLDTVEPQA